MKGHVLELRGCTPEPLGNYLKGLGVFRLVAEQADPEARAWWKNGTLHIHQHRWSPTDSKTAERQCAEWLADGCRFTPLIAPWQTGTGYLPLGKRSAGGDALAALLNSEQCGLESYQRVFGEFAASAGVSLPRDRSRWVEAMKQARTDWSDADLFRLLRNRLRTSASIAWLDSVGVSASRSRDQDDVQWFRILASGGGEASGQYIVNHQQRLKSSLLENSEQSRSRLEAALVGTNLPGVLEPNSLGAMYYPSLMKVPNAGQGFLPDPQRRVNPWDFILLLEGSLVWSMAATRRKGVTSERGSFPFYCRSSFGGSTTIGPKEVEDAEGSIANGELWCPTWEMPSALPEVRRIFAEGRIQVADRISTRSLDFALATTGLGTDRGIQAFHRYSLLKRSGSGRQTTLLAVPTGCFPARRSTVLTLLTGLRPFADNVAAKLVDSGQQPRRLLFARIKFERAWFEAIGAGGRVSDEPGPSLLQLLVAAGGLMRELGTHSSRPGLVKMKQGGKVSEQFIHPVGGLDSGWLTGTGGSGGVPEFRLARAIAGIASWGETSLEGQPAAAVESIRANLLPLQRRRRSWAWDETSRSAVWSPGASLEANLAAVLRRRLIDAQRGSGHGLPLWSPYGAGFVDLLAYWHGEADEDRLVDLIHGLALVDSGTWPQEAIDWHQHRYDPTPDLQTGAVWFDAGGDPHTQAVSVGWHGRRLASEGDLRAAFELPRIYHLLKLCFIGGRLPHRPVERRVAERTGEEAYAPVSLDVLTLLQAGRLADAAQLAAQHLHGNGYPPVLRTPDLQSMTMPLDQCRRLAGMLLIPLRQPGICAALAITPETTS